MAKEKMELVNAQLLPLSMVMPNVSTSLEGDVQQHSLVVVPMQP
jgi:hypothetical protein